MNAALSIESVLRRTIGLDPVTVGATRLELAVRDRMAACGITDRAAYATHLVASGDELQELIEAVVVPETFFFREPAALATLADMVRNGDLLAAPGQPLEVLSLPCASGEEPYSIAIALLAAGCASESFCIDGVDVNRKAVRRAREATYGAGSFRVDAARYAEWFEKTADGTTVRPDVRDVVRVEQGNVLAPDFAPPRALYDAIFCRNLLIYFDVQAQQRTLTLIARHLRPGGVLFVAAADAFAVRQAAFAPIAIDAACAFRPRAAAIGVPRGQPSIKGVTGRSDRALTPAATSTGAPRTSAEGHDDTAAADAAGANPQLYVLLGAMHESKGDIVQAEECYRRAVYLQPDRADALLHLSLLYQQRGDDQGAARLRTRAQRARQGGAS